MPQKPLTRQKQGHPPTSQPARSIPGATVAEVTTEKQPKPPGRDLAPAHQRARGAPHCVCGSGAPPAASVGWPPLRSVRRSGWSPPQQLGHPFARIAVAALANQHQWSLGGGVRPSRERGMLRLPGIDPVRLEISTALAHVDALIGSLLKAVGQLAWGLEVMARVVQGSAGRRLWG